MIRIYIEQAEPSEMIIRDENHHYLKNVMRVKENDQIVIFNQDFECLFSVESISKKEIVCQFIKKTRDGEKLVNIHLLMSIIKGDKFAEIVDSSVQFGISSITPVVSQNCHIRTVNFDRLESVAITALQQSGGLVKTTIRKSVQFDNIFKNIDDKNILIYGDITGIDCNFKINQVLKSGNAVENIYILIGPEGGFSDEEEVRLQESKNSYGIRLSNRVLRAENAAISAISVIYHLICNNT